jgi:uncharacterized protein (DUF2249 family)
MSETLDLRQLNRVDRKPVLFQMLSGLKEGESLNVYSNFEPVNFYPDLEKRGYRFTAKKDEFKWVIQITKKPKDYMHT